MLMQMTKRVSLSRPWGLNRSRTQNRAVGLLTALNTGQPDASVILTRRWTSASGRAMCAMCHRLQTLIARFQRSRDDRTRQLESDRTLDSSVRSFPVRFQTRDFTTGCVRSCPTGLSQRPVIQCLLCALHISTDWTQTLSVQLDFAPESGHKTETRAHCCH